MDIGRNRCVRKGGGSLSAQISVGKGRPSRRLKSRKLQVKSSHVNANPSDSQVKDNMMAACLNRLDRTMPKTI